MTYLLVSVAMVIVAYLSYVQGHINGTQAGKEQVLEEDIKRLDIALSTPDPDKHIIDHLSVEDNNEITQSILNSLEVA